MPRPSSLIAAAVTFLAALVIAGATLAQPPENPPPPPAGGKAPTPMQAAAVLIAANQIPCTLTDARVGKLKNPTGGEASLTEMACKEGRGYVVLVDHKLATTDVFDCLIADQPDRKGRPAAVRCRLPENVNPAAGLQRLVDQSGRTCSVDEGRFIGRSADNHRLYEVACADGRGLVLDVATASGGGTVASTCLAHTSGTVRCTLTTPESELGEVALLAAAAHRCATLAGSRYMLTAADGSDYFEIACPDGQGYVLRADLSGALKDVTPCSDADQIGGGCRLTDPHREQEEKAARYTSLAKAAGFDCAVSKFAPLYRAGSTTEIVELACSNRPDGGVGFFPALGGGQVLDCVRALDEGFQCTLTPESAVYPHLSDALRAAGDRACVVSSARPFGRRHDGSDFVEVGCADGGSGLVLVYPPGSPIPKPKFDCSRAARFNGGCQLPANRRAGLRTIEHPAGHQA